MIGKKWILGLVMLSSIGHATAGTVVVFYDDFDGGQALLPGVSGGFSGVVDLESVQGYAGIGNGIDVFGGSFLRNATPFGPMHSSPGRTASSTFLTLDALPHHSHVSIDFLLAIIDSWDGNHGTYGIDRFNVRLDGNLIFSETFSEVNDGNRVQSYIPPAGGLLAFNTQLGFSSIGGHTDSAYDMSLEPSLVVPHSASSLTIEWFADGSGWQGGADESWAIDNVQIGLLNVPEPASLVLWSGLGIMGLIAARRRKRAA